MLKIASFKKKWRDCSSEFHKNTKLFQVGPGPGGITRALLGRGARGVHVIEKDPRFLPSLKLLQEASGGRIYINLGDCLKFNMSSKLNKIDVFLINFTIYVLLSGLEGKIDLDGCDEFDRK